jgi:uncharacterized protein
MRRWQEEIICKDLHKKMVFLAGPRQAGKTTLAKALAALFSSSCYLNYDSLEDRRMILNQSWLSSIELLILDEIHKMKGWKNYLKGLFDTKPPHQKILVTGSARLETFRKVGDSLAGRYFLHRLLPLSCAECQKVHTPYTLDRFLERGGFPEPFLDPSLVDANRWRLQYTDSLLREDVFDLENIHNITAMRNVFELLRMHVGAPISYSSMAQDIGISPNTVKKYLQIFEALYIVFRIIPFSKNIGRSLLKEPKIYFFDTGLVKENPSDNQGKRFENFVAVSLLKAQMARRDIHGEETDLHFLRTKEGHEVDFALTSSGHIESIIEVKISDSTSTPGLRYFHQKYQFPSILLLKELRHEQNKEGILVKQVDSFLRDLFL